jgi:uncharacterized membrane protein
VIKMVFWITYSVIGFVFFVLILGFFGYDYEGYVDETDIGVCALASVVWPLVIAYFILGFTLQFPIWIGASIRERVDEQNRKKQRK